MTVDRRTLLKTLALSATLPYLDLGFARTLVANPPPPTKVYILLHGMFFLEFDGDSLWVATPKHPPHHICVRRQGETQPHTLAPCDIVFKDQVQAGSQNKFPDQLVTFPKSALGATSSVLGHAANYHCRMQFPWPDDILSLRKAPKSQFCPCTSTNIGSQLSYGDNVATITCLVYTPVGKNRYVESYYAEHPCEPTVDEVNAALQSAQGVCGSGFDLTMNNCKPPLSPLDPGSSLPDGVSSDDEKALRELPPQLGHCPSKATKAHAASRKGQSHSHSPQAQSSQTSGCVNAKGGDPSSCPQLGIT